MSLFKTGIFIIFFNDYNYIKYLLSFSNGEKGIRTLDTFYHIHAFQACSFDLSDISPYLFFNVFYKQNYTFFIILFQCLIHEKIYSSYRIIIMD